MRKSAKHLAVIGPGGIVPAVRRPQAPSTLSPDEAAEWKAIVNRMPADWFPRETHPMLVQLCRMTIRSHHVSKLIATANKANLPMKEYDRLLRLEQSITEAIARLSTRMRISQQSTYDRDKRKGYEPKQDPWSGLTAGDGDEAETEAGAG